MEQVRPLHFSVDKISKILKDYSTEYEKTRISIHCQEGKAMVIKPEPFFGDSPVAESVKFEKVIEDVQNLLNEHIYGDIVIDFICGECYPVWKKRTIKP